MSTLGQLKALAIKDLQVSKRSKKRLCCELLVPLFVLPMIIMAAKLSDKYVQAIVPVSPETCVLEVNTTTEFNIENLNPADYAEFSNAAKSLNVKLVDSSPDRIFFNKFDRASKKFEYYIGIGGHTAVGHDESNKISDGWISDDPYQSQGLSDYFNLTLSNRQAQEEHMKLQYTIDQVLLKLASGNNGNEKVTVKFFPENPYGFSFLTISLPFLFVAFVFSSLIPMAMIIKDVIYEGETEIKTYLLVMGMSRHSFYASHFLFGLVKMSIIMAIITIPFFWAFKLKVNILLVIFVFLYVLFCVAFALLCGTILQRVGLAVTLNVLVTLGLTALAFQAANRLNVVEMCLHSLNPLAAFRLGLTDLELMQRYEEEELQLIGSLPYSKIVTNSKARLESLLNNWPQCPVSEIDYNEKKFLDLQFDVPPASFGFFKPDAGSVFLFVSPFLDAGKLIALNIWSNLAFGNGELSNIKTGIIQKKLITGSMMDLFKNLLSGLAAVFGLTYGITMLLNTVITERVKRFKHQIHLASAKWPTYWIAQFISDLAYFSVLVLFVYIATVATIGLNFACSLGILPIYFLYFASSSLASYVISFAFESPTKGSVFILAFHTIIPPLVAMAYFAGVALVKNILQQEPAALATIGIYGLRILFPAISLIFGQVSCISNCNTKKEVFAMYTEKSKEGDLNESWKAVITLSLGSLFYLFWLAFIEMKIWNRISHPWHVRRFRNVSSQKWEMREV
uniref:ABC transporter permease n=1 Tax=Bursaphelenchus xylophilus TaxID=6326 RepID=A0A1I7S9I0_BURXY